MDFTRVTSFLDSLSGVGIPGCELSIHLKGNEVYRHRTGFSDLETQTPIGPDTMYAIWSSTKEITCAAALRFYEEGRYTLLDPLYEYLPEFKNMTVRTTLASGAVVEAPNTRPIRIVDIFAMTSGITYNITDTLLNAAKTAKNNDLAEFVSAISKEKLAFEPGTHWSYGLNHEIVGRLIEVLSGKTIGEYLYENVFAPLGMNDTHFFYRLPEEKAGRMASVYTFNEKTKKNEKIYPVPTFGEWRNDSAAGGLISSVDDYAKFANTLCAGGTAANGYRLLGRATAELMRTNHLSGDLLADYYRRQPGYGYGLGVRVHVDKGASGSNSSIGEFGWCGYLGTYEVMDPAAELVYVYAQQLLPDLESYVAPRLRNIVYSCL